MDATDSPVISGIQLVGEINTADEALVANVRSAVRRQHPQIRPQPVHHDRVCLVAGGASLADTERALVDLAFAGAKVVTVNGALAWCLARNIRPSATIVLDARETNARFVEPNVPQCRYLLASQCHPTTFDAVDGRDVWIWHATLPESPAGDVLQHYYGKGRWFPVTGGTTVTMRALMLLHGLGYRRFDVFGLDSCWMGGAHHAYEQPENESDRPYEVTVTPSGGTLGRRFTVSPWHLKQFEDVLQTVRLNGDAFLLNVHGDGLIAWAMRAAAGEAAFTISKE